jgi:hypothetical protein
MFIAVYAGAKLGIKRVGISNPGECRTEEQMILNVEGNSRGNVEQKNR